MEILTAIIALLFISAAVLAYQFSAKRLFGEVHLPEEIKGESEEKKFDPKNLLAFPAQFTDQLVKKANIPVESVRKRLISAGRPMNVSQFFAAKFLLIILLVVAVIIGLPVIGMSPEPPLVMFALAVGFIFPDFWLSGRIKKRQAEVLRSLPHIIDLLNICVGAGLDFMVAVNRVIEEFRPCVLVDELKAMVQEIHMGSSRRDALKNLASRINSPDMISFVRTLLQADRMGTPIGEALKMQSEEIRITRFQRGEEMALKAPIKLLFPLLAFILPVVLIIVAGPILLQFTRGGGISF